MNVRLSKVWQIPALVVSERSEQVIINAYEVKVHMTTNTTNPSEQNVAYERMQYWFDQVMTGSVLISQDHPKLATWQDTNSRCLIFPQDPVDQLVGIMLYYKLSAIVENRIIISELEVSSAIDDYVIYHHSMMEDPGNILDDHGWWSDSRPTWNTDARRRKSRDKVISLSRPPEWKEHDLDWPIDNEGGVVVADFNKDADK